jgi:triosephosphate isomerase
MYIESPEAAKRFISSLKRRATALAAAEAWIAPPFTLLPLLKGVKIGGQTLSADVGAHTGGISSMMLKEAGASFCLVGHSERRALGESNEDIHAQLAAAANAALAPVLCVGERERTADGAHFSFIEEQLSSALRGVQSLANKLVVAYEPVWAIGKGATDAMKPQEVEETVIFIRKTLAGVLGREPARKIKVLYGGSVEPLNAERLIAESGIDGFLVGHASAKLEQFVEILKACKR